MTTRPSKAKIKAARSALEDANAMIHEIADELGFLDASEDAHLGPGEGPFIWRLDELDTSSRRLRTLLA